MAPRGGASSLNARVGQLIVALVAATRMSVYGGQSTNHKNKNNNNNRRNTLEKLDPIGSMNSNSRGRCFGRLRGPAKIGTTLLASSLILLLAVALNAFPSYQQTTLAPVQRGPASEEPPEAEAAANQTVQEVVCDSSRQFKCSSERRCIPAEWRCDFTEQCLDGEDEFRCVGEWCDFGGSLCNWRNSFPTAGSPLPGKQQPTNNNNKLSIWRRLSHTTEPACNGSCSKTGNQFAVRRKLAELSSSLKLGGRFAYVPMVLSAHLSSFRRSAEFSSSLIGQTASMCQIRFKYALWVASLEKRNSSQAFELTLSLFARRDALGKEPATSLLWSRKTSAPTSGNLTDWFWAVVELGHARNLQLHFQASLGVSGGGGELSRFDALAALTDIKFQACAWPAAGARPRPSSAPPGNNPFELLGALDEEDFRDYLEPDGALPAAEAGHFRCSNGLQLEQRKLCNFVDDCMADGGAEDEVEELCSQLPARETFETLPSSYYLGLETAHIRRSFGDNSQKPSESQWALDGNWPANLIKVTNRKEAAKELSRPASSLDWLPEMDHTFKNANGHYLSLEFPAEPKATEKKARKQETNLFWLYLYSPLLIKAEPEEQEAPEMAECRLKFFFNLVANKSFSELENLEQLPYRSYITIEHFLAGSEKQRPPLDGSGPGDSGSRKLDSFIFSHLIEREKLKTRLKDKDKDSIMELAGVDFWREVNVKLAELKSGDIFYIRLAIIAERSDDGQAAANGVRMSLNIDDLSSHFGCHLAKKLSSLPAAGSGASSPFSLDDYIQRKPPVAPIVAYNRRPRRPALSSQAIQFEPSKLIVCVFGLLAAILGLMMLIVFVVVPYVEKITINYHDQLSANLDELDCQTQHSTTSTNFKDMIEACELTTESDWEQVSRQWRRSAASSSANLFNINNHQNSASTSNLQSLALTTPMTGDQPTSPAPEVCAAGDSFDSLNTSRMEGGRVEGEPENREQQV